MNPIEASNSHLHRVQIPSDGDEEDRNRAFLSCLRMLRTCHLTNCREGGNLLKSSAPSPVRRPKTTTLADEEGEGTSAPISS